METTSEKQVDRNEHIKDNRLPRVYFSPSNVVEDAF